METLEELHAKREKAKESIDSGEASKTLEKLIETAK